jgi:hypothetical protein
MTLLLLLVDPSGAMYVSDLVSVRLMPSSLCVTVLEP